MSLQKSGRLLFRTTQLCGVVVVRCVLGAKCSVCSDKSLQKCYGVQGGAPPLFSLPGSGVKWFFVRQDRGRLARRYPQRHQKAKLDQLFGIVNREAKLRRVDKIGSG